MLFSICLLALKTIMVRYKTPRMPCNDIGVEIQNKTVRDVARHVVQSWSFTKVWKNGLISSVARSLF